MKLKGIVSGLAMAIAFTMAGQAISMQAMNGRNGTKQIAVTQYVLMPAGDTIEEKLLLVCYR